LLRINVDVIGNLSNQYRLGRYITIFISIVRENKDTEPLGQLFADKLWKMSRINVFSEEEKDIEISLQFETGGVSENASMFIFAMGTPFGRIVSGLPAFEVKRLDLELVYFVSEVDPPEITGDSGDVSVRTGETITLWVTAIDNVAVTSAEISVDDADPIVMVFDDVDGRWEYDYTAPSTAENHTYALTVYDDEGLLDSSGPYDIFVTDDVNDTTPPVTTCELVEI